MKYEVTEVTSNRCLIKLIAQTAEERLLLESDPDENIDLYYHAAVNEKYGENTILLSIDPNDDFPKSAYGKIETLKSIGGV